MLVLCANWCPGKMPFPDMIDYNDILSPISIDCNINNRYPYKKNVNTLIDIVDDSD